MSFDPKPVAIDILIDGKLYAKRHWHQVPRIGDTLLLADKKLVTVRRVVWAEIEGVERQIYESWVQLVCTFDKTLRVDKK